MKRIRSCVMVLSVLLVAGGLATSCGEETAVVGGSGQRAEGASAPATEATQTTGDDKAEEGVATEAAKTGAERPEAKEATEITTEPIGETAEADDGFVVGAEAQYEQQAEQYANVEQQAEQYAGVEQQTDQYADGTRYEQAAEEQAIEEQAVVEQAAVEQADIGQYEPPSPAGEVQYDIAPTEEPPEPQAEIQSVPAGNSMSLSIPALGLVGVPVVDGFGEAALEAGTQHVPGTGFPWQEGSNTYIAGHRIGSPGTASDHVFYGLPNLVPGDQVVLTDENGETYEYAVTEIMEVTPFDLWVTNPVAGRDVVTLQTCIEDFGDYSTEGPDWAARYIVRADRVV